MARFALTLTAATLLASAAIAQAPDELDDTPQPTPVMADADGDGIVNHEDPDFLWSAQGRGHGPRDFVDADGDGVDDNAPDDDGDGIVNHLDDDWERPGMGTVRGMRGMHGMRGHGPRDFVDADGDGVDDNAPDGDGDGIVNHLDDDHQPAASGGQGRGASRRSHGGRR